ncbi:hypothetical protein QTP88_026487 [Uroleucon formosanum]
MFVYLCSMRISACILQYCILCLPMRFCLQTVKNVEEVQETIEKLKNTISDREAHLALAHTRLLNRTRREGVELCRDELELRLYEEVVQLEHDVQSLQNMMAESAVCQRRLKQSIACIDVQMQAKQNSLHIDDELCAKQRKRIIYIFLYKILKLNLEVSEYFNTINLHLMHYATALYELNVGHTDLHRQFSFIYDLVEAYSI